MPPIQFATQSYRHDSLPISAQRVLNLYAEAQPQGAKSQVTVHGSPGISLFATAGTGPIRGAHLMGGLLYIVSGERLYSITNDPTPVVTNLGGNISGTGIVSMDDNGDQLMIVNGVNGYVYDTTGGFRLVTDTDFTPAKTVTYLDSFFAFDRTGTAEWFRSDSLDGESYNALAFGVKESHSDNVLAVVNFKQVAYILGERSSELWPNAGAANFPWQRMPGGTIDRGIIGSYATAQEDQTLFIIGDDRMAYKVAGTQLSRISTHAIEQAFQGYTETSDCFGLAYTWKGHKFIVFTFPTQQASLFDTTSWIFDISTNLWHERLSFDINGNPLGRWRGNVVIDAYGKVLVGDAFSGKVGYFDDSVRTEFGCPMYAQATSQPYAAIDKSVFHSNLTLDMETGVGLTPGEIGVEGNDQYTKVLLHFDGTDGSTAFIDSNAGGSSHTWTANGDAQIDTGESVFGGSSGLFDGTGDYISTPDHADYTLGSDDWTIDFRFYSNATSGSQERIAGQRTGAAATSAWSMERTSGNIIRGTVSNGSSFVTVDSTTQFTSSANTGWHHAALVRTGNILRLFIDGVQEGSDVAFSGSVPDASANLEVATYATGAAEAWTGWLDEFRLSVGVARWTTTFTPPTGPYQTLAEIAAANSGVDPQIMLDISDDGGRNFGPQQPWAALGRQGAYKTWVRWPQLGRTERGGSRVYRITISDPVKRTIIGAASDIKMGL